MPDGEDKQTKWKTYVETSVPGATYRCLREKGGVEPRNNPYIIHMGVSQNWGYYSKVPIITIIVFWGLYWGPLVLGNYYIYVYTYHYNSPNIHSPPPPSAPARQEECLRSVARSFQDRPVEGIKTPSHIHPGERWCLFLGQSISNHSGDPVPQTHCFQLKLSETGILWPCSVVALGYCQGGTDHASHWARKTTVDVEASRAHCYSLSAPDGRIA